MVDLRCPHDPFPGECPDCAAKDARIAELEAELAVLRAESEKLWMAIGLASTIKGDMLIRVDDPIGMMQEVVAYVYAKDERMTDDEEREVE